MIADDDLGERLGRADPALRFGVFGAAVTQLTHDTEMASRTLRGHRRRRFFAGLGLLLAVILGVLVTPTAAGAIQRFLAVTNWDPPARGEVLKNSPWIDTGAADFPQFVDTIYPAWLPLPPGVTTEQNKQTAIMSFVDNPGLTQQVSVERGFEAAAYCSWVGEWLKSDTAGDTARRSAAAVIMLKSLKWPGFAATDAASAARVDRRFAVAAGNGDRTMVELAAQVNACPAWDGVERTLP